LGTARQAAAYDEWLLAELRASIDDPRPSIAHDDVMAELDAEISALEKARRKPRRSRNS
jgi:hypothetical protein